MELDSGSSPLATLRSRKRDVDGSRDNVRQSVELQRTLVGDDTTNLAEGQPGGYDMFMQAGRKMT